MFEPRYPAFIDMQIETIFVSEIGDIAGVAEVTIKQSYRLMIPRAHELFPSDFVFSIPISMLPSS